MRRCLLYLAATFLAVLVVACFNPHLPEELACGDHAECPPGLRCEASVDVCVPHDQAAIASLRFVAAPVAAEALVDTSAITLELLDAHGMRVPFTGGIFSLEVATNPVGVALMTPVTGTATSGIIPFGPVKLN